MATVTLDAVIYDGTKWDVPRGQRRPEGDTPGLLYDLGFRQSTVYHPKYETELILTGPGVAKNVPVGSTIVHDNGALVTVLAGDRTNKPAAKKPAAKKAVKKATKATKKAT